MKQFHKFYDFLLKVKVRIKTFFISKYIEKTIFVFLFSYYIILLSITKNNHL